MHLDTSAEHRVSILKHLSQVDRKAHGYPNVTKDMRQQILLASVVDFTSKEVESLLKIAIAKDGLLDTVVFNQCMEILHHVMNGDKGAKGYINYHWGDTPIAVILINNANSGTCRLYMFIPDSATNNVVVADKLKHDYGFDGLRAIVKKQTGREV